MATVDSIAKEITDSSQYVEDQRVSLAAEALAELRGSMVASVVAMVSALKCLRTSEATTLNSAVATSVFTEPERTAIRNAVHRKLTSQPLKRAKGAPQCFKDPPASQDLFPAEDWEVFNDRKVPKSMKIQTMVDRLNGGGFVNVDQKAKCDLATILFAAHFGEHASPQALYDLGNDIKRCFDNTPMRNPTLTHFVEYPNFADLPDTHKASGWGSSPPIPGNIATWTSLRTHIAARKNSNLLKGNAQPRSNLAGMTSDDIFRMGWMMATNRAGNDAAIEDAAEGGLPGLVFSARSSKRCGQPLALGNTPHPGDGSALTPPARHALRSPSRGEFAGAGSPATQMPPGPANDLVGESTAGAGGPAAAGAYAPRAVGAEGAGGPPTAPAPAAPVPLPAVAVATRAVGAEGAAAGDLETRVVLTEMEKAHRQLVAEAQSITKRKRLLEKTTDRLTLTQNKQLKQNKQTQAKNKQHKHQKQNKNKQLTTHV